MKDKELKRKWIEALRSGKYQQGRGSLRNPETNCFCCLGVLCDIVDPEGWMEDFPRLHRGRGTFVAVSKLGVENPGELVRQNDLAKKSFLEIADYIEEHE